MFESARTREPCAIGANLLTEKRDFRSRWLGFCPFVLQQFNSFACFRNVLCRAAHSRGHTARVNRARFAAERAILRAILEAQKSIGRITRLGNPADDACLLTRVSGGFATRLAVGSRRALRNRLATGGARTLRGGLQLGLAGRLGFLFCNLRHVALSFPSWFDCLPNTNHDATTEVKLCTKY